MRNPNGYGGVIKLPGKRRRPYLARITDHWETDANGKRRQIFKPIGYFEKQRDALSALEAYSQNPSAVDSVNLTFGEVYETWSARKFDQTVKDAISESNIKGYKAAFKLCGSIKDMRMIDIKAAHLQKVVDESKKNEPTLRKLRVLFSQIYSYAMANDIINKDYSDFVTIPKSEKKLNRASFTEDEIQSLWDNLDRHEWIDTVLIQIYTGMRIGELLGIVNANIDIDGKYMRGGSKTAAGKNRVIPLHDKIIPLIKNRMSDSDMLILNNTDGGALSYYTYRDVYWRNMMEQLNMTHLPHDCRHTFASRADTYGLNKVCIKRIIGHASSDITDSVYTHKEIEELIREVNKLP